MLPRFHLSDISTVLHYLGTLICLMGILMIVPACVGVAFGEQRCAVDFFFGLSLCLCLGSGLRIFKAHRLDRRCSLLLIGLSWIIVGIVGSIPMYMTGSYANFIDAVFDGVSCITTTGTTLASDVDRMPYSLVVWHALLTLVGAQAVILVVLHVGLSGQGGFAADATTQGYSDLRASNLSTSRHLVWMVSLSTVFAGTLVIFIVGMWLGMGPDESIVDGFTLAVSAWATSSFVPHASSLVYYHSSMLCFLIMILMLLGALNFGFFIVAWKGRVKSLRKNFELRGITVWFVILVVFMAANLTMEGVYTTWGALVDRGFFMALSAATTCGMQTIYPDQLTTCLSDGLFIMFVLAAFLGACSCSTAGGVKFSRIMQVLRWFVFTVLASLLPRDAHYEIRYTYFGTKRLSSLDATRAMTIMFLYIAFAAIGAMVFIAHGYNALLAIFTSVSYVCNTGINTGVISTHSTVDLKLLAIMWMWLGRLEFVAIIAAFAGLIVSIRPSPHGRGGRSYRSRKRRSRGHSPWRRMERSRKRRLEDGKGEKTRESIVAAERFRHGFTRLGTLVLCFMLTASCLGLSAINASNSTGQTLSNIDKLNVEDEEPTTYTKMSIAQLLSATARLNGEGVKFTGEVMGSPIVADDAHKWVNVNSDGEMIGVLMTNAQVASIENFGDYNVTGDTLIIKGVYHQVCNKHQGELDVHANKVVVKSNGGSVDHTIQPWRAESAAILLLVAVGFIVLKRLIYGRSRWRMLFS